MTKQRSLKLIQPLLNQPAFDWSTEQTASQSKLNWLNLDTHTWAQTQVGAKGCWGTSGPSTNWIILSKGSLLFSFTIDSTLPKAITLSCLSFKFIQDKNTSFSMTPSHSFFFKDTMARKPADPEEELRWMSQEVRGYVEAVLNSLAANVPKVNTCSFSWFLEPCDL